MTTPDLTRWKRKARRLGLLLAHVTLVYGPHPHCSDEKAYRKWRKRLDRNIRQLEADTGRKVR